MQQHECDVLIVGGGITAALVAQKLAERRPDWSVIVVEAGKRLFDAANRMKYRQRNLDYGENIWPGDFIPDQSARGIISRTMAVGGSALHWGGVCNRFSEEDTRLKSMYGLAADWPIEWKELERYYCEAERRMGVSGEPSPLPEDWRSEPYPMAAMTMTWNLIQLKAWAEKSGIRFWTTPQAKNTVEGYDGRSICHRCNTCEICPTGARYSPDWTFKKLLAGKNFQLHDQTLVRRLALDEESPRVASAHAVREDGTGAALQYRARTFILASGYCWSPHLLLSSTDSRFPNGLANSSDHVGRYMTGHLAYQTTIDLDAKVYPGMNEQHSPHLAAVLPLSSGSAIRSTRPARLGERRRPRGSVAGCERETAAWRCIVGGLALADEPCNSTRPRVLRCASGQRQPPDARPSDEESVRRSAAGHSAPARPGDRSSRISHPRAHSERVCVFGEGQRRPCRASQRFELSGSPRRRLPYGHRPRDERRRQLRPHARSSESVRRRRADATYRRLHERDADLRGAGAQVRR